MKKPKSQKSVSIFEVFEILKLTEKSKVTLSLREWSLVRLTVKTSPSASNPSSQLPKILTESTHIQTQKHKPRHTKSTDPKTKAQFFL